MFRVKKRENKGTFFSCDSDFLSWRKCLFIVDSNHNVNVNVNMTCRNHSKTSSWFSQQWNGYHCVCTQRDEWNGTIVYVFRKKSIDAVSVFQSNVTWYQFICIPEKQLMWRWLYYLSMIILMHRYHSIELTSWTTPIDNLKLRFHKF
jgi:hypothetical protein